MTIVAAPDHNEKLKEIFEQFRKFNLKLEADKCEFLMSELGFWDTLLAQKG